MRWCIKIFTPRMVSLLYRKWSVPWKVPIVKVWCQRHEIRVSPILHGIIMPTRNSVRHQSIHHSFIMIERSINTKVRVFLIHCLPVLLKESCRQWKHHSTISLLHYIHTERRKHCTHCVLQPNAHAFATLHEIVIIIILIDQERVIVKRDFISYLE